LNEKDAVLIQVYRWLLAGASKADITETLAKEYPAYNARDLIMTVLESFQSTASTPAEVTYGWLIESNRECYRRLLSLGDVAGALAALKQIHELTKTINRK
jgi:hypothetical protein